MKLSKLSILAGAALAALAFVGCKPTEANYRSAYDAALNKRNAAAEEQMRPKTGLLSDDGPQLRMVDGDSIYVSRERLFNMDGTLLRAKWAVAVGLYKMDTNAKASIIDIREKGFKDAQVVKLTGGRYYALCDTALSLESACAKAKRFRTTFPAYPYVGLPASPVLVNNP